MYPERAKSLLPIIQAYAQGRTIQYRADSTCCWQDGEIFNFEYGGDYRVKPEPREFWLAKRNLGGDRGFYFAVFERKENTAETLIHVREVLE